MNNKIKYLIIAITFGVIVSTGIIFKQPLIRMVPLIISIGVMLLCAEANRYAYLIGGINSIIYAFVYVNLGLYSTAAYSLFVSFPLQIVTFVNWSRHAYKNSTQFKKMSAKMQIATAFVFAIVWISIIVWYAGTGSSYAVLDTTSSLLGIVVTVLSIFAFVEYSYIAIVSGIITIVMNIQVMLDTPGHITYLIFSLYSMWATVTAFFNIRKIYNAQAYEKLEGEPK